MDVKCNSDKSPTHTTNTSELSLLGSTSAKLTNIDLEQAKEKAGHAMSIRDQILSRTIVIGLLGTTEVCKQQPDLDYAYDMLYLVCTLAYFGAAYQLYVYYSQGTKESEKALVMNDSQSKMLNALHGITKGSGFALGSMG